MWARSWVWLALSTLCSGLLRGDRRALAHEGVAAEIEPDVSGIAAALAAVHAAEHGAHDAAERSEYCESGGGLDPVCQVKGEVESVGSEIDAVLAHLRAMRSEKSEEHEAEPTQSEATTVEELGAKLSRAHATADAAFTAADTDHDGVVSSDELSAMGAAAGISNSAALLPIPAEGLDRAAFTRAFGSMSASDVGAALGVDGMAELAAAAPLDRSALRNALQRKGVSPWNADRVFEAIDGSADGALSKSEVWSGLGVSLPDASAKLTEAGGFAEADADKNGQLSEAELTAALGKAGVVEANALALLPGTELDEAGFEANFGPGAKDVAGLRRALIETYGSCEAAWEHAGASPLGRADFAKLAKSAGVTNGEALFAQLFPEPATHSRFAAVFHAATPFAEFRDKAVKQDGEKAFKVADEDGDGFVSRAEFGAYCKKLEFSQDACQDFASSGLGGTLPVDARAFLTALGVHEMARASPELKELDAARKKLAETVAGLRKKQAQLKKEGKLDVALEKELRDMLRRAEEFETSTAVAIQGALHGSGAKALAGAAALAEKAKAGQKGVEAVIPIGDKWWRYGYEHSYVQAVLLATVLFACACVTWGLRTIAPPHPTWNMHQLWFAEMNFSVATAGLSGMAVLTLVRNFPGYVAAAFRWSTTNNIPKTELQYQDLIISVSMDLVMTVVIWFVLMRFLIDAAEVEKDAWRDMERSARAGGRWKTAFRASVEQGSEESDSARPHRGWRAYMFASGDFEFVRQHLVDDMLDPTSLMYQKLVARGELPTEEQCKKFSLAHYFEGAVNYVTEFLLVFTSGAWGRLFLWYAVLAFLAGFFAVSYMVMMSFIAGIGALVLALKYRSASTRAGLLARIAQSQRDAKTQRSAAADLSGQDDLERTSPRHKTHRDQTLVQDASSVDATLMLLRGAIFFLMYGAAHFLTSAFCWRYYAIATASFLALAGLFVVLFALRWAKLLPAYAVASSLPPHHSHDAYVGFTIAAMWASLSQEELQKVANQQLA